jgi:RNA polymerase sigma-70 factor (ECF subfamily)
MSAAEVSVRRTSVGFAEFGEPATIPLPVARGPSDGVVLSGGSLRDGGGDPPDGPLRSGAASPELPDGLVAGAVHGDCRARDELLALIHPLVLRYCRIRLGRHESLMRSADDVAQDVCMAVVSALRTYQPKGLSFRAFVYGIAAHKVTDAFRAMDRNRTEPVAELPDTPVTADGPEHQVLAAERSAHVRALLAHLTPRQREVLVLRLALGMSAEETAQAVQSTSGSVRVTQHRALLRLRRIILQGESAAREVADRAADAPAPNEEPEELVGDGTDAPADHGAAPVSGQPGTGRHRRG